MDKKQEYNIPLLGKKAAEELRLKKLMDTKSEIIGKIESALYVLMEIEETVKERFDDRIASAKKSVEFWAEAIERISSSDIPMPTDENIDEEIFKLTEQDRMRLRNINFISGNINKEIVSIFGKPPEKVNVAMTTTTVKEKPKTKENKPDNAPPELFVEPDNASPLFTPAPKETYMFKRSGNVNGSAIADAILRYMKDADRPVTLDELCEMVEKTFPEAAKKWNTVRKGIQNVTQAHLKNHRNFKAEKGGLYRFVKK